MKKILLFLVLAGLVTSANAAIVVSGVTVTANGINFDWSYTFALQPDQNMRQNCTGSCAPGVGVNDFAGIYDFFGYTGVSSITNLIGAPFGFALTIKNSGDAPPLTAPSDDPAIPNFLVSLVSGGDIIPNPLGSAIDIFRLNIQSQFGNNGALINYAAQAQNKSNTNTASNVNSVAGPSNPVPEPATLGILGAALIGLGALRLRR